MAGVKVRLVPPRKSRTQLPGEAGGWVLSPAEAPPTSLSISPTDCGVLEGRNVAPAALVVCVHSQHLAQALAQATSVCVEGTE